jgi:glycosyltransferase involved in cell wall biosynthesis
MKGAAMLRITFCWTHLSGYVAACFRALAAQPSVALQVVAFRAGDAAPFDDATLGGYPVRLMSESERRDDEVVERTALGHRPQVLVISGWSHAPYRRLVDLASRLGISTVLAADTPIRFDWRQRFAPLIIGRYLGKFDAVVVPGERGYQLMRFWGVDHARIWKGLYGVDHAALAPLGPERAALRGGWPRRFVFVGRLVPEKGIAVLLEAYRAYRDTAEDPWPLAVLGTGALIRDVAQAPGVVAPGFVQPVALGDWLLQSGVFVLPSLVEPWGAALVEAASSGLPILCTDACGAAVEVVRDFHSGRVVPAASAQRLAEVLWWFHERTSRLASMGAASAELASAYSAERWAERWLELTRSLGHA